MLSAWRKREGEKKGCPAFISLILCLKFKTPNLIGVSLNGNPLISQCPKLNLVKVVRLYSIRRPLPISHAAAALFLLRPASNLVQRRVSRARRPQPQLLLRRRQLIHLYSLYQLSAVLRVDQRRLLSRNAMCSISQCNQNAIEKAVNVGRLVDLSKFRPEIKKTLFFFFF